MAIFKYGQTELDHLKKRDKKLALAIERIGPIEREVIPDLFTALIHNVVGQQIATKAAATVWARLKEYCREVTPLAVAAADTADIQKCGLSFRKAAYIKGISLAVLQNELNIDEFPILPDDEIVRRLSCLHGVGIWTAEMLMIFSLERPNIVSWGDLAIRRGMMSLYGIKKLDRGKFDRYRSRYSPYGSVASLYLWRLSAEKPAK